MKMYLQFSILSIKSITFCVMALFIGNSMAVTVTDSIVGQGAGYGDDTNGVDARCAKFSNDAGSYGVVVSDEGTVYWSEYGGGTSGSGKVGRLNTDGSVTWIATGLHDPRGMALDADGNLWVASYSLGVYKITNPSSESASVILEINVVEDHAGRGVSDVAVSSANTIYYSLEGDPAQVQVFNPLADVSCGNNKSYICHLPPGNPDNANTLCINNNAVDAHLLNHGDRLGQCAGSLVYEDSTCKPKVLSFDDEGNLYHACEHGNAVKKWNGYSLSTLSSGLGKIFGMDFYRDSLYITEQSFADVEQRLSSIALSDTTRSTMNLSGEKDNWADSGPECEGNAVNLATDGQTLENTRYVDPTAIAIDEQGCLYVVDHAAQLVRKTCGLKEEAALAFYPAQHENGTLMFEDNFPDEGDYDFNDMVVQYNVAVKKNNDTNQIEEILWRHILLAVGADYDNAFSTELPINFQFNGQTLTPSFTLHDTAGQASVCIADAYAQIEIGVCSGNTCRLDNNCDGLSDESSCSFECGSGVCEVQGECSQLPANVSGLAIVKFFPSERDFSERDGFFNTQSSTASKNGTQTMPFHWQVSLRFPGDGVQLQSKSQYCDSKGDSDCVYPSTPPYNPFITVMGDQAREVHLVNYAGSMNYVSNLYDSVKDHAGSGCGVFANHNAQCFKTAAGLPWAIDVSDDNFFVWPKERESITDVFVGGEGSFSFYQWVEAGGKNCTGNQCEWWSALDVNKRVSGVALGDPFVLKTSSAALVGEKARKKFFTLSALADVDGHGLDTNSQGLGQTILADWDDVAELDASQVSDLCGLLDSSSETYRVTRGGVKNYTSSRSYYLRSNETNSTALLHGYVVKYLNGNLLKGSSNIGWSSLRDSLGGCESSGSVCTFSDVECYVILESWSGNQKALGKWRD